MRLLKIAGIVLGVLIVIVAGALFWVSTQDFSKYQDVIADQVKQATGRDLKIAGKFSLKPSLSPSLQVQDVSFQNASWGSRPQLGTFKQLDIELQLIPLIFGDIKVNRVVLSGADILLETNKDGRSNWEFTVAKPTGAQPAPANAPQSTGGASLPQIDKLTITDSLVTIRNAQTGRNMVMNVKTLDATGIGNAGTTKLDLDGVLNGNPVSVKASIDQMMALANGGDGMLDVSVKAGASSVSLVGPVKAGVPAGIKIAAQGDNLSSLKPLIGAALPPLGPYSLDGRLSGVGKDAYRLDIAKLKVGTTEITGNVAIASEGGKPKLTADLSSPRVNAKDFLKGDGKSGGGSGGKDDGRVFPNDPLPVEDLRLANAVLTLKAGELFNDDVKMQNLVFPLTLQNGRLSIKPTVTVSGGAVVIDLTLDASGATPQLALALQGNNVNLGDLMKMLQNSDAISGGPSTVDIRVRGAGNSVRAIMASLNGTSSVSMIKGVLNNKRISFLSSDFLKLLTGGGSTTEIYCAVSKLTIVNGVANSETLVFDASNLSARGSGSINLGTEGLNLLIDPETKQPALASLAVPVRIGGTLSNPSATPDLARGVMDAPKNVLGTVGKAGGSVLGTITGGRVGNSGGSGSSGGGGCGPVAAAPPAATPPATAPDAAKKPAPAKPPAKSNSPTDKAKKLFN